MRAVPASIRTDRGPLDLPAAHDEEDVSGAARDRAVANDVYTPMIGMGYHDTITPP